ncbi:MAG TPA: YSC84-related protein [Pyrinomonadaceae bacterium]|nr:YSC84-related protein [Pyrinomonadaceae bacterium]
MKSIRLSGIFALALLTAVSVLAKTKDEERAEARKKADATLQRLYKAQPSARAAIKAAAGYAVFNNRGTKILIGGGGKGNGIAVDNSTKKVTYMKMREIQAGLGMGVKKFSVVFVFQNQKALDDFVDGDWDAGGQTTAAAKSGDGGGSLQGAVAGGPGVWVYQMTDKGLALELTVKGTKYSKDDDLN